MRIYYIMAELLFLSRPATTTTTIAISYRIPIHTVYIHCAPYGGGGGPSPPAATPPPHNIINYRGRLIYRSSLIGFWVDGGGQESPGYRL